MKRLLLILLAAGLTACGGTETVEVEVPEWWESCAQNLRDIAEFSQSPEVFEHTIVMRQQWQTILCEEGVQ